MARKYNNIDQPISKKAHRKTQKKADKKKPKKRKRNPFVIGSDARQWKGLFGLKRWLIK